MEQNNSKWLAALLGIVGGMAKYIHLAVIGNIEFLNKLVEPAVTAALCGFMGVFGKQLFKWSTLLIREYVKPWLKSKLNKNKKS